MTLFTARDTLRASSRGYGKRLCLCCSEWMNPADFAPAEEWEHGALMVQRYGATPCIACADDHQLCVHCGAVRPSVRMIGHDDGPVCVDCVDEYEDAYAVEIGTARMIEGQWRAAQ